MTRENDIFETPLQIVNEFANFFTQASEINVNSLHLLRISEIDVVKALKKLKPSLTAGPDLIPSFLLKDCDTLFAKPLATAFNIIIQTCQFPDLWKSSRVSPIFKAGNK